MLARLRPRSVYDVLAVIGCFAGLSTGGAYAANTVFSTDIVDNEVYSADVRNDTLTGGGLAASDLRASSVGTSEVLNDNVSGGGLAAGDLRAGSVGSSEVASNSLGAADLATDSVGALELAAGAVGGGELKFLNVVGLGTSVPPGGGVGEVVQTCPNGIRIGGGASFDFPSGDISVSMPGVGQSWIAEGQNNGNLPQDLSAWVICLIP